jgi:hypothetical protein
MTQKNHKKTTMVQWKIAAAPVCAILLLVFCATEKSTEGYFLIAFCD